MHTPPPAPPTPEPGVPTPDENEHPKAPAGVVRAIQPGPAAGVGRVR